ncbi:uncharacterized protein PFL1_05882 [Pseudozyma flocculosa PF-1]|uniref:Protein-S-isoprenylcysteine O-methyltransferase n=1 Tax=Pseudozyma flocculosa PF-1 TaxID=1277687 RepID=A0A061H3T7_9BASI|nr:uncharacterized protein PFL1_05882 [Pseudozyma flocculosa PF-1]EPQ26560.1 hypothetical protein PFL1_05882 [Pseudozyma flocculosa PF-1]
MSSTSTTTSAVAVAATADMDAQPSISSPMPARSTTTTPASHTPAHTPTVTPSRSLFSKYTDQYVVPAHLAPAALQICITAFPLGLVAGLVLPRALGFLVDRATSLVSSNDSANAAQATTFGSWYTLPQLHLYLLAWCTFHLLEFVITAAYNPTRLFSDSFLLNNGLAYHVAHVAGLVEFGITATLAGPASGWKRPGLSTLVGLILVVVGQSIRSLAMIHAHNNFSHIVAFRKRDDHQLVKTGVYAVKLNHPSILLGNPLGCLAFSIVLWRFFAHRIRVEEKHLIEFFKDEYVQYKKDVGTHLPFIP